MSLWLQSWFGWSLTLIFGFPALVLLLGELVNALETRRNPLAAPVAIVRNAVLPVLALQIFFFNVLNQVVNVGTLEPSGIGNRLFQTVFWIVVIYATLSFLNVVLFEQAAENTWRAEVPTLFRDLSRFVIVLVGFAVIMSAVWGANLGSLITALGVGSLVIGLALQDTLGNLFSGIAILFEQPYGEGDWIEVDGTVGKVEAINWRATRLIKRDGDRVIMPNSVIASSTILNESRPAGPGYEFYDIGFSYDDPPNKVKRVLLDIIRTTEGVVDTLPPWVRTVSYDDSSITYRVAFGIEDFSRLLRIQDEFATRIWYAAKRNGLTIPFPIRTVYNYDGSALEQRDVAAELDTNVSQINAALAPLEREDARNTNVQLRHFGRGETILRTGEPADTLYTILSGEVVMRLGDETLTQLSKGDILGASSLLRSEPSNADFVALSDTQVVSLPRSAVETMVKRRASFARELEDLIESREQVVKEAKKARALRVDI